MNKKVSLRKTCIKKKLISLSILGFLAINLFTLPAFASVESDIVCALQNIAAPLNCAQVHYKDSHGGQTYPHCPGSVCWNSSSLVGSANDLQNALETGASIDAGAFGGTGDVRIRYRYQNNTLYGFAYRCKEPEPAGCDQMWRGEWKFPVDCVLESSGACVGSIRITDVGQIDDFSGACAMNNYTCE